MTSSARFGRISLTKAAPAKLEPTTPLSYVATPDDRIADSVAGILAGLGLSVVRRAVAAELFIRRERPRPADSGLGGLTACRLLAAWRRFPSPSAESGGSGVVTLAPEEGQGAIPGEFTTVRFAR